MNIVWLKRDLRLLDNPALSFASQQEFIVIYIFEPSMSYNYDFDIRHWRFVYQSLTNLEEQGLKVIKLYGEAVDVFTALNAKYNKITIYSHQETGNDLSFKRDLRIKKLFASENCLWRESKAYGVSRGLKSRKTWDYDWLRYVKDQNNYDVILGHNIHDKEIESEFRLGESFLNDLSIVDPNMQYGGEGFAQENLKSFLEERIDKYLGAISYPEKSRYYCSRISTHISWGNISIRQIYQACERVKPSFNNKKPINQFMARLKWHCHFIQKLESEPRIEFENLNMVFNNIRQKKNKAYLKAWKQGQTGYPLIDAAMRCVEVTGYLNFRLRATVVSFLTHILWQPWQEGSGHLARKFLDYEPGIHFSQFQMQAGTTGINTIRIYNPIKQSLEKDKDGIFIKKWLPELANLPSSLIHEPWNIAPMDEILYGFTPGKDYPKPIIKFEVAYRNAQDKLWSLKKSDQSKSFSKKILRKHARKVRS